MGYDNYSTLVNFKQDQLRISGIPPNKRRAKKGKQAIDRWQGMFVCTYISPRSNVYIVKEIAVLIDLYQTGNSANEETVIGLNLHTMIADRCHLPPTLHGKLKIN